MRDRTRFSLLTEAGRLRPHKHIRATITSNGGMLLDLRGRGHWYLLTPAAALVWEQISDGRSPDQAAVAIAQRYGITPCQARTDLGPFLADLLDRRIFQRARARS
jgi:hypothetical protein